MRQTIKQYMASVRKAGAPDDMDYQTNAWPYPQAKDSHIAIYLRSWPRTAPHMLPNRQIRVAIVGSDIKGYLMRVADDAPTPAEIARALKKDA